MSVARSTLAKNVWVAAQLRELAARLELDGIPYRPRAYRRAAETLEQAGQPIEKIRVQGGKRGLESLPGIGPHIAAIVGELLDTGQSAQLERLRAETPVDVMGLLAVDTIGPKTLKRLWDELQIRTLDDLEQALADGRVEELPGFGKRSAERLRQTLRIQRHGRDRISRNKAAPIAARLCKALARQPGVSQCAVAGSLRRGLQRVGDIDLVAAADDPASVAQSLLQRPEVEYIYSRGPRRVSVRLKAGIDVDLRVVEPASYGSALLYFTGNRGHTVALRRLALAEGLRLNEYGLFRGRQRIAGETEADIYAALSLPYVPPEKRLGESEVREALRSAKP